MKSLLIGTISVASLLAGCVGDEANPGSDDDVQVVDGKADGASSFKMVITTTSDENTFKGKETPKLPGAGTSTAKMTCAMTATDGGTRYICTRGKEQLTVLFGVDEMKGAAIYLKSTTSPDSRMYFYCDAPDNEGDGIPEEFDCTPKSPKTNIGGQLVSPFASDVDNIHIFNAHEVDNDLLNTGAWLLRGMKPFRDADYADLKNAKVDSVLIFKKATSAHEIEDETAALVDIGVSTENIVNVPFGWKDFANFKDPCVQTVQSLKQLVAWQHAGKKTYFHCTVGEDRTGYLAGLYRLLVQQGNTERDIFDSEMCEHGYSSGNPVKPLNAVAKEVDADLTPIYLKMAYKISKGELTPTSLDESVCNSDPANAADFTGDRWNATKYRCLPSSLFRL
ncbi:MAG TPA: hypothetical protein VGM90_21970 [Kofleriaceae bacterium]|jgi:hypothetical protein